MIDKKQIRNAYKEKTFPAGVFAIVNTLNGKMFMDVSFDIPSSENRHGFELKMGTHRNRELQADWKKNGACTFKFKVLASLEKEGDTEISRKDLKTLKEMVLQDLGENVELY